MDLVAAAKALLATPAGKSQPAFCPGCFLRFAVRLPAASENELDGLRVACGDFWKACVAAVITARSDDAVDELRLALQRNHTSCTYESTVNAAQTAKAFHNVVPAIVDAACRCIHHGLARGTLSACQRAEHRRKVFSRRHDYWPSTTDELFPQGPAATLSALIRWGRNIPSSSPVLVLSDIVAIALPSVLGTLSQSTDIRASLAKLMITRLRGASATAKRGIPLETVARNVLSLPRLGGVRAVASLLGVLQFGPDARKRDLSAVIEGHESELFSAILDTLEYIDDVPNTDTTFKALASAANALQVHLKLGISVLPPPVLAFRHHPMTMADVMVCFLCTLRTQEHRRCDGPGCGRFVHDLEPEAAFCPGCKTLSYCSPVCRKQDLDLGHKNVCAAIRRLIDSCDYEGAFAECTLWEQYHLCTFTLGHNAMPSALLKRASELFLPLGMLNSTILVASPTAVVRMDEMSKRNS